MNRLNGYDHAECAQPAPTRRRPMGYGAITAIVVVVTLLVGVLGTAATVAADRAISASSAAQSISKQPSSSAAQTPPAAPAVPLGPVDPAPSVVKIFVEGCGLAWTGTGWVVADGAIVTAAHVVAGAEAITVTRGDGSIVTASVIRFDPVVDLAVLSAPGLGLPALTFRSPSTGDSGLTYGYTGGGPLHSVPVIVTFAGPFSRDDIYSETVQTAPALVLSSVIDHGDSGGPVVDSTGVVIGVIVAGDDEGNAYAMSVDLLSALADQDEVDLVTLARCDQSHSTSFSPA